MDKIAKAIIAAVVAGSTAYVTATLDGQITAVEYVTVIAGIIVAGLSVWATTNAPNK